MAGVRPARQARRRSDEERLRLRAVLDHLPVGVFIMDPEGQIIEVNEEANRLWGGEAPMVRSISDYGSFKGWWADTGEPVRAEEWGAARAIKGETSLGEAIDVQRQDGTRGTILNSAVPIRSLDGDIVGAVAVNQDVTDLRRLQKQLEREHRQAR